MSNLTDHVSYIKGLAEGMKLDTSTNEGMMISKMLEVMAEMAQENAQLRKDLDELNEYVESIDDDLAEMEEALFGDEDEDDEDGDSCSCGHCHGHHDDDLAFHPAPRRYRTGDPAFGNLLARPPPV